MEYHTYTTKIELNLGPVAGPDNETTQPAGYVSGLPQRLWGSDSFEWVLELWEDGSTELDCTDAAPALYASVPGSGTRLKLCDGTVGDPETNRITFQVPAGYLSGYQAGALLLMAEVPSSGDSAQTTVIQTVYVELSPEVGS